MLFLAMAVGGLIPLLSRLADDLRRPSSRPVIPGMQPLVRAAAPTVPGLQPGPGTTSQPVATATFQPTVLPVPGPVPGMGALAQAAARSTELMRTGAWLVVSLVGTAFGIALSASLIKHVAMTG